MSRLELNRYLENWYNAPWGEKGEPLNQVSYSFWKREVSKPFERTEKIIEENIDSVPLKIQKQVLSKIAEICQRSVSEISLLDDLSTDLGLDSLDFMQISLFLDQHYDVVDFPVSEFHNVKDIMLVAAGYRKKPRGIEKERRKIITLFQKKRLQPLPPEGKTIHEAFLASCDRMKNFIACTDEVSGSFSYRTFRKNVLILSQKIHELPGDHVGILLPSSTQGYLVIFATLFSRKIPVMLNWTTGVRNLDFANDLLKLQTVITSEQFLENLHVDDLGQIEEKFVMLEDLKQSLQLSDKVKGLIISYFSSSQIRRMFRLDSISENDLCVILFTSGSEVLPRAVPLSHRNILSNQKAIVESVLLKAEDVFYGVIPPFHSFGFSVTGLLPLLSGLNVVYSPDPTDDYGILRDLHHYGVTVFGCAPSFIKAVFQIAKPEKVKSIRLFAAGGEKTPEELFTYVDHLVMKPTMIEGYGITECGPVVCINRPNEVRKGVGKPLPGVQVCTIGIETKEVLPSSQEGEICIYGPNVFDGYLGSDRDPFITLSGKKWYRSGDLGFIDEEGNLFLSGRISRFIKLGGEMVSLEGIEQEILQIAKEKNWSKEGETQSFAIVARERNSTKPEIVLFSSVPIEKEAVNMALLSRGYGRIAKVNEVKIVDNIPFTATGKVHYRMLEEILKNAN
jgi:long-chain-fatty-acid--[acyl-carrier-protein] ligase